MPFVLFSFLLPQAALRFKSSKVIADPVEAVKVIPSGSKLLVVFLSESPDPTLMAEHDPVELAPDRIRLGDRVIYQWCPDGILASPPVGGFVEKHWSVTTTGRNWNTVTKLATLLGE